MALWGLYVFTEASQHAQLFLSEFEKTQRGQFCIYIKNARAPIFRSVDEIVVLKISFPRLVWHTIFKQLYRRN